MDTNNHVSYTGQIPIPNTSGLKQLPQSVEQVYKNRALATFPQQGQGLNCDMPVNGLSPSLTTISLDIGTTHHPASTNYDYLWNYPKAPFQRDCHGPSQYQVKGLTSSTLGSSFKGSLQETWRNGSSSPSSVSFSGQDFCNFNDVKVAAAANGTHHVFCEASQPVLLLASSVQSLSPSTEIKEQQEEEIGVGRAEELETKPDVGEGLEPSDVQADLRVREYKAIDMASVGQTTHNPLPRPDVSNLDDPSQLPSQLGDSHLLNSDSMEPFGTDLSQEPVTNTLYDTEESEAGDVEDKVPLVDASGLGCHSYSNSASFSFMAGDSQNSSSLFNATSASPVLGDSVMQDSASEMDEDPEGSKAVEPSIAKEDFSQNEVIRENTSPTLKGEELEPGELKGTAARRRVATPEAVSVPLLHGWKREVRIRKGSHRWQGETWYYAPCGKRMKQFPEVIKYLSRNTDPNVRREHFSFSPRMPVGDFYEERDAVEGVQWVLLKSEEIPSRILAITGKRGRPRNLEKVKAKEEKVKRGRGRPPKVKMIDLLSKSDAKQLRKLENQDILSDVEKVLLSKLRKKMRRKARNQDAKLEVANKLKEKREQEEQQQKLQMKAQEQEKQRIKKRKSKMKSNPVVHKVDRKQLAQQRRLEERKRQQFILEELKKPTEDMCLSDHQPLPDFPHVPGLVLPSCAFSDCITTVEFLNTYGKVLGLDGTKMVPSLSTLQEGLFNVGDSLGEIQDLLLKLLRVAMFDPGLPSYCQSLKILGEKVSDIGLNRDNVSEALRIFLAAYGFDIELCESLRSHPFQAHPPHTKAAVLAFLVNELNSSTLIINEVDKTLENMSYYRKNKWIIEGKIRRLKFVLCKKMGRPESHVPSPEDSQRRGADENEEMDANESILQGPCVGEEEGNISCGSIVELENQIEKLTKRQLFLRKKILSSTQRLRCVSLGQDRYRRCYWILPHLGGIFIEGLPENAGQTREPSSDEVLQISSVKTEEAEVTEEKAFNTHNHAQGHPRKQIAVSENYCKSCHCAGSQDKSLNGLLEPSSIILPESKQDLSQSAFLSWLTQNQTPLMNSTVLTPESSPPHTEATLPIPSGPLFVAKVAEEKQAQWVNMLPRTPCSDPCQDSSTQPNNHSLPPSPAAVTSTRQDDGLAEEEQPFVDKCLPSDCAPCVACTSPSGNFATSHEKPLRSNPARGRGRPPSKLFKQLEQKYLNQLTERPIPVGMKQKWWWIKDPVMLESLLKALHPRGIREKTLHKHLAKHLEHLKEMCTRPVVDPLFQFIPTEGHPISQEALDKWSVVDWTFQVDLSVLQWVEDLEQRVFMSDLQQRGWTPPSLDSIRTDLKYFEHQLDPADDITVKVKREDVQPYREPTNPLDLAVLRLLELEQNLERRYMKEPLWLLSEVQHEKVLITIPEDPLSTTEIEYSITPRLRLWRQTAERCRSAAQLTLCLQQLERSLAWERSIIKVTCLYCRKGDNDEYLLLCDSCDRGCHTYCHRPRMTKIPDGDWFCPTCVSLQGESTFLRSCGSSRRPKKCRLRFQENSPSKPSRKREHTSIAQYSSGESPLSKRKRIATRSQSPDLTFCEIILMEMESHDEAWPFLEPVNPRLVPGYRKIIKNPMDFSTMRHKLLNGKYSSCEEFADDAELVFSNCQLFNEDDSEVGKAGLALKKFYESRWEEFSQERIQSAL
ncbi:bromodomain adjacent to zinc finger domain protein 2A [Rhinophrynus dorsalis]